MDRSAPAKQVARTGPSFENMLVCYSASRAELPNVVKVTPQIEESEPQTAM